MALYCAIDLHSNNNVPAVIDGEDKVVFSKRLPNDLDTVLSMLEPYKAQLHAVAVESTFNWYWLVDGLMEAGYRVQLVNTAKVPQYAGVKHSNDEDDAFHLAHLMRLGILPTGYIYPKEERTVRDLLRKRAQMVQLQTQQILSIQTQHTRNTGQQLAANHIRQNDAVVLAGLENPNIRLAINSNQAVRQCVAEQVAAIERQVLQQSRLRPEFKLLLTVVGIGKILALTIMLETGDIGRFAKVGNFASYCRCVDSKRTSNGKKKGEGNVKNGNKYLAWAFIEAANFARRYSPRINRFYQRKLAKTNNPVATKAIAHKLARACYYVMRDQVPFDEEKLFG